MTLLLLSMIALGFMVLMAVTPPFGGTSLGQLPFLRDYRSRRASSYDRTGGNRDWFDVAPGETKELADIRGAGCIKHIWMTVGCPTGIPTAYARQGVLQMYWEDCEKPSVDCPFGDFFGIGHGIFKDFVTAPLQMSPQDGKGMNAWWAMPFNRRARIVFRNDSDKPMNVYFYIDYEEYPAAVPGITYFHTQWRRENPTEGWGDEHGRLRGGTPEEGGNLDTMWFGKGDEPRSLNTTGDDNYVMLDAEGEGIFCGAHLDIDIFRRQINDWFGEGDDMIFIDGEPWPPSLHGTGTEDWYHCAFCPSTEYCGPYHGILLYNGTKEWPWKGKQSVYRYYIEDPIRFRKSCRVTIEHGHGNKLSNDYSSTAYYYLTEAKSCGAPLPPVQERLPRPNEPEYGEGI